MTIVRVFGNDKGAGTGTLGSWYESAWVICCVRDGAGGPGQRWDPGPGLWGSCGAALRLVPDRGLHGHQVVGLPVH